MEKHNLESCPDEPLSLLLESARSESPKKAKRYLKAARRAIKKEIRRIEKQRKHSRKHPERLSAAGEQPVAPTPRRVQVVNAHPGAATK